MCPSQLSLAQEPWDVRAFCMQVGESGSKHSPSFFPVPAWVWSTENTSAWKSSRAAISRASAWSSWTTAPSCRAGAGPRAVSTPSRCTAMEREWQPGCPAPPSSQRPCPPPDTPTASLSRWSVEASVSHTGSCPRLHQHWNRGRRGCPCRCTDSLGHHWFFSPKDAHLLRTYSGISHTQRGAPAGPATCCPARLTPAI